MAPAPPARSSPAPVRLQRSVLYWIEAIHTGQPSVTQKVKHKTAPSIMVLPWAKLTVFDTE